MIAGVALVTLAGCTFDAPAGTAGAAGTKTSLKEAPMLTKLVKEGKLPELAKRLPAKPAVAASFGGTALYGGTLKRGQLDAGDRGVMQAFATASFVEWDEDNRKPVPSLAEKFESNDDMSEFTMTLRSGLKWSDGEPYTADDVLFVMQNWLGNKTMMPSAPYWFSSADKSVPQAEKVSDTVIKISFTSPTPLWPKYLSNPSVGGQFVKPLHYLRQFHPDFTDQGTVDAQAKAAGFDSWDKYFADRDNTWTNPDVPVMGAYRVITSASSASGTADLERNPYYYKTDADGRQLPFVDRLQVQILAQEALDLRAANGDLDFQAQFLGYNTTQVYLQNAEKNGFHVDRWTPAGSLLSLCPNLSHKDPEIRELFSKKEFRGALSQAINREAINKSLLGGLGVVMQPVAPKGDEYYSDGIGKNFLEFDADAANSALDELGLTEKDSNGVRLMNSGKPLDFVLLYVDATTEIARTDAYSMVVKDLANVGIKLTLKPADSTLYTQSRTTNDYDIDGTTVPQTKFDLEPVWYVPTGGNSHSAPAFGQWYASAGESGEQPSADVQKLLDSWDALRTATSDDARVKAGKAIMKQHSDECYMIGILALPFVPVVINNDLLNVRDDKPELAFVLGRERVTKPEQLAFATGE